MNFGKIILILFIILSIGIIFSYFIFNDENSQNVDEVELIEMYPGNLFILLVDPKDIVINEGNQSILKATFDLNDEFKNTYDEIGVYDLNEKPIFIIPIFTASAYAANGFYDFYSGNCDESCLNTKIVSNSNLAFTSSSNAVQILQLLGYDSITDIDLHKNPEILNEYSKVIVLHNEYVTKIEFDAITSHPNVVYLYPNALYAEIEYDDEKDEIKLVKGHEYPDPSIKNGFDWEFENTHPFEFDILCDNWEFYEITNGVMLNCYPENIIWQDEEFLKVLKNI